MIIVVIITEAETSIRTLPAFHMVSFLDQHIILSPLTEARGVAVLVAFRRS